jgi:peptide chain release factor 1
VLEEKLRSLEVRFHELEAVVAIPDLAKDAARYRDTMREHSRLALVMDRFHNLKTVERDIQESTVLSRDDSDLEMRDMAREELKTLEARRISLEEELKLLLLPRDPLDDKNIIMEIRAGTGGEEAALFAYDLYRMYGRYAEKMGWKTELMDMNETELGGLREVTFSVTGKSVYESLRYESGVHRVQRVPETEAQGRIHTSTVTVAVLPEMEETEIDIRNEDLRIDTCRASGPGGQCVNTTDSAIRITHIPSGLVVVCQDEKSQIKNKAKAMRVLRARLFEMEENKALAERAAERKSQVGSGDRSERIRTYNFPQNRLTDHRVNVTLYKLDLVMQGDIDEIIDALKLSAREEMFKTEAV